MVGGAEEKVKSNFSRFVLIIWFFVVLILTSSYTASLTSMLTVQQLQPAVTDVNQLLKNGDYVGYQQGSFMQGWLKTMKFPESKLRVYNSPQEYVDALDKGSGNGGVAAIFDEIPYLNLFLVQNCDKYVMVGPTYKTDGFGFVFPIGSPLVGDVSRAILNVTEGDTMVAIEQAWFQHETTCSSSSGISPSYSLTFNSFRGLFLITAIASTSALLTFILTLLFKKKDVLPTVHSESDSRIVPDDGAARDSVTVQPISNSNASEAQVVQQAAQEVIELPETHEDPSTSADDLQKITNDLQKITKQMMS